MATYKKDRVNEELKKEMAQIVREVKDPRIGAGFVTVTHCEVSGDLKFAKIYYSVLGGEPTEVKKGLISARGYIRRQLAERLNLRNTPELTFIADDSMERGAKIFEILSGMEYSDET
ncbi:MAG: 30S ribosome-binding factor RbfA [Oscillospiraceae bacterium]|nr:30S ribosome-binding factor RbfA [Oscillospiraceae bacterium]